MSDNTTVTEVAAYIDGKWQPNTSGEWTEGINPATEEVISRAPVGTVDDLNQAIAAARRAFDDGPWPRLSPAERGAHLKRYAEVLRRRSDELKEYSVTECGAVKTPFSGALGAAAWIEDAANQAINYLKPDNLHTLDSDAMAGLGLPFGGGAVLREPIGVVAAVIPFNAPGVVASWKMAAALAVGNTMVMKPSPWSALQINFFAEVAEEAELPPGVFNVVYDGPEVGPAISVHPDVDGITFTGSTAVGRDIQEKSSATLKRLVLQLGGKSPNIVFADALAANPEGVAQHVKGMFSLMAGQACAAHTRILIEASVHDEFVELMKKTVGEMTVGDPGAPGTDMGPLIRESARERVERYVAWGIEAGGTVITGGKRPDGLDKGFYYEPTLFTGLDNNSRLAREEIFGPVALIIPFEDEDDAIRIANDCEYGLSSTVHTPDFGKAWRIARRIDSARVEFNGGSPLLTPYGGIKQSGYGKEMGPWGFDSLTYQKALTWPL